jgi:penicillin-binding protein 1A
MKTRSGTLLKIVGWGAALLLVACLALGVAGMVVYSRYEERAAKFDLTKIDEVSERSAVYDANGELYSYFGGENRLVVPLAAVSNHFIAALLAREDSRFWEHEGVDFKGVIRAVVTNLRAGDAKQGASTITQQLARNACELRAKTIDRKIVEAVLARRIEATYSKQQILDLYVNRIYFGSGFYGIETASRGYFGKPAAELTLGESAMLAGLIRSPNRFSPSRDLPAAEHERNTVLDRMVELNLLKPDEATAAKAQRVTLAPGSGLRYAEDYVMDAVLREATALLAPEVVDHGGLKIFMTVDPQLQRLAQSAADRRVTEIEEQKNYPHPKKKNFIPGELPDGKERPTDYLQAAVVAIDNHTGAIRAIAGGRDHQQSKYSRALLSRRQVGSTFKPFVYGAAFERGLLPGTVIDDSKILPGEFRNISAKWSPENSDGEYSGLQPAAFGLLKSRNTMSIRVGEYASLPKVHDLAMRAGIGDSMPDLPVAFLGAFETTLKDLTAAYTAFPNGGVQHSPHLISSVQDREGRTIYKAPQLEKRLLSPESAWMVSSILEQTMKTGTASKSSSMGWKKPGGGKTGTTNDCFDAWFIGYTSSLTCGVWVGMDQPQTILEKGYGSTLALPIWVDFMQQVPEKNYPAQRLDPPSSLVKARLCSVSGARATSGCLQQGCAYDATLPPTRVAVDSCKTHPDLPPPPVYSAELQVQGIPSALPPAATAPSSVGMHAPAFSSSSVPPPSSSAAPPLQRNPEPIRMERTASGMRITHVPAPQRSAAIPVAEPVVPSRSAVPPQPEPRVMRAIPVERSERTAAVPQPGQMQSSARAAAAEILEESRPVRVQPTLPAVREPRSRPARTSTELRVIRVPRESAAEE